MNKRILAPLLSLSLGVFTLGGVSLAQEVTPGTGLITNANGDDVSSGPGSAANGDGQTVIYGDITTGPGYTVIGAPPTTTTTPNVNPVDTNPAPAPVDTGTAPVDSGTAPVDTGPAPVESAPVPVAGDADGDNLPDTLEAQHGTDQYNADTDGDGVADGDEINIYFTSPTNPDSDGDGLTDGNELFWTHSNPLLWDTDGDGWGDGDEVNTRGTDPLSATSFPGSSTTAGAPAASEAPSTYQGDTAPVAQSDIVTAPVDTVSSNISPSSSTTIAPGETTALGNDGYVTAAPGSVVAPTVSTGAPAAEPAAAPAAAPAASTTACSNYGSWYDAQVAYEGAGGTSSSLADSLDPNRDGVACESMQV